LPEPDIEEYAGGFQITFYKGDQKSVEKGVEKGVEKSVEKIAALMSTNPYITQKELSVATGLSRRGVEKNISLLKKAGKIKRIGPAKGGHWEVVRGED
jgi:ATP-dependent DNA helicase RecG